jgi:hypothetical protein
VIRYRYNSQIEPPAPFIFVTIRNPISGAEVRDVPAQVDSAADRTVLTAPIVQQLQLPQMGIILIGGLGGSIHSLPAYIVNVGIHDFAIQTIKFIGTADEPWVILGRDVLNAHRLVLDGPQLALEIG